MSALENSPTPPPAAERGGASFWPFLIALSLVAGLAELAFIIVNISALPVYLEFGLNLPNLVGVALGAFYLAEAAGNPIMGSLGDKWGRRRVMVMGALISVTTCLATAATAFFKAHPASPHGLGSGFLLVAGLILLFRICDGFGAAMLWPAVFASIGDRIDEKRQAQAMGVLNITYLVGIAIGPFVGGAVNESFGARFLASDPRRYAPSFVVAAACFGAAALIAFFVAPRRAVKPLVQTPVGVAAESEITASGHEPVALDAVRKALRDVPMLMLLGFLIFAAVGLIGPYVKPFFMKRYELDELEFGKLLLFPALIIAAVSVPLGKLSDVWGKTNSIHVGMGLCALALWGILFSASGDVPGAQWHVVALGSLLGIGFMMAFPAYMAYLAELSEKSARGGMIGAVRMAQGVGALVGAALSSPLYTLDEKHLTLFGASGALLVIGFILSIVFVREKPKAAEA